MSKVALIIGHNSGSQGAIRVTDGRTEYSWNGELAERLVALDPKRYRIFRRLPGLGYTKEIAEVYSRANQWAPASGLALELHFNSFNTVSTGTELLTSGTTNSLRAAKLMQPAMVDALGLKSRPFIVLPKNAPANSRGHASLWAAKAPALLLEPYFGSNPKDCRAADLGFDKLVANIHKACGQYFEGK